MITRLLYDEEKDQYNAVVHHPVQTWEWGDFQISQGHRVYRLGTFDQDKMISAYTLSFHAIPKTKYSIGTVLRGPTITNDLLSNITKIGRDQNIIFIKLEPDIYQKVYSPGWDVIKDFSTQLNFPNLVVSPKVAFYPYSFVIDLTKSEGQLLAAMHPKTRYNIRVANRHGVKIEEKTDDRGFEVYLKLLFETTRRQGFYLHSEKYHRDLWSFLKQTSLPHLFFASYKDVILAAFMILVLKDRLFYPYGASTNDFREVMGPTLLMWEVIKFGQSLKLKNFDMWGCLGPDAKEGDLGYGFHRFKQGYGGAPVQFVGTYDLILNEPLYKVYNFLDPIRWSLLRLKAKFLR